MKKDLNRLFKPAALAVIGGGAWCAQVIRQSRDMGYTGEIWPVHPKQAEVEGLQAYPSVADLPGVPDAAFVGVNRHLTLEIVGALSAMGAGGAVCFASGFSEAAAEDQSGDDLQAQLVAAAGEMPILGPNCYGFINALDGALLWPDQHGCTRVDRGVAILTQSSNIAINLTMQKRRLPVAYTVTCGNMAQTSQAEAALALLDDPRVTAIGLHIEGFGDLRGWEALAAAAHAKDIPLVALKVGASEQAQKATVSHTASLAGSDAGAQAFLDRLGIARVPSLPAFLETLKLLHVHGRLEAAQIASISCSGGEASLIADMALPHGVTFPALEDGQKTHLRAALGPMVALSNPLDYHTYIWRDEAAMTQAWSGMTGPEIAMTLSIVDYPTTDPTDWHVATRAACNVRAQTGAGFGVVATLPELMPQETATDLIAGGVVPFMGLEEALVAIKAASQIAAPSTLPVALPGQVAPDHTLTEGEAKAALAGYGVPVPQFRLTTADTIAVDAADLTAPFAIKGVGLAHKSEHGAVRLGISAEDAPKVAAEIGTDQILIEEMASGALAELLVGVTRDPAHGYVLTVGAGGVLTEVLRDTASLLLPSTRAEIDAALDRLNCAPILRGYRGKPPVARAALLDAIEAVSAYVLENAETLGEVEINPLICTADRVVAVDALIRKG
ncbi:acetyl coenzyme A synthetase (ADP forming), alpha domain [Tritonibacter multivorans]|uniref:Acetyl coenzyme A synthetase (ADP forming), alpha domain n=1 Tax=Tritonibacter multivorans TaxID=928856 RepID=A0A0P1GL22_9RHOB|nr:acetate--CoA ligase family protein [Tritonibacter multivorans]MDA7421923.1 acetate--CoA ligase family protein [Tritonibacter multivorans]CUH76580.1 acetyl coenzyme A synthetase (ADP forming), alpha domain [Tritonibacter multivorans]SFD47550.1 acetyl-CoA synthetase [Tritonibacter multivorans]